MVKRKMHFQKYKEFCKYIFLSTSTILLDFNICNGRGAWMIVLIVGR
jgi:hypothetical protein